MTDREKDIEVFCDYCEKRNERAERLIRHLTQDLERQKEHYEIFKEVARLELKKSWLERLFT